MGKRSRWMPAIGIDSEKLRAHRLRKRWKQRELAAASGFSEEYISKLERAPTTANKGTKIETLVRLAAALDISIEDLVQPLADDNNVTADTSPEGETHQRIITSLRGSLSSLATEIGSTLPAQGAPIPSTVEDVLRQADQRHLSTHWLDVEAWALDMRSRWPAGSREWSIITLRICALARQQAGDAIGAKARIREVEDCLAEDPARQDPTVTTNIHNLCGWLLCEQYGDMARAHRAFSSTLKGAIRTADIALRSGSHHFRLRSLTEFALASSGAWLGLRPEHGLNAQLIHQLRTSLQQDWPSSWVERPTVHSHYLRYIASSLVDPSAAAAELAILTAIASEDHGEHIASLAQARWHISMEDWDRAAVSAKEAFHGYCQVAYPYGIALASSINGYALLRRGPRSREEYIACCDAWMLARMLHMQQTHPTARLARRYLRQSLNALGARDARWLRSYLEAVDIRAWRGEGIFTALAGVRQQMMAPQPTAYVNDIEYER